MFEATCRVPPEWIDSNGHMHDARYIDMFHLGVRKFFDAVGLGDEYRAQGCSLFNMGMNLDYVRELFAEDSVRITIQLVDWNSKMIHLFAELHHAEHGYLCAANERLLMHVDMTSRRSTPFPAQILNALEMARARQGDVVQSERMGRRLQIRR